jgi:Flp pilus assembly protein TadD
VNDELVYQLYEEGRSRLDAGNARGAAEVLELAVEHEPDKASLRETLARAYFAAARVRPALEEFERAVELDPSDAYAHFGLGRCHEREGRLGQAAKHLKLACALSGRAEYRQTLARVQARLRA